MSLSQINTVTIVPHIDPERHIVKHQWQNNKVEICRNEQHPPSKM